jgi:hypothetical protein
MHADDLKQNVTVHGPLFPEPVQIILTMPMGGKVNRMTNHVVALLAANYAAAQAAENTSFCAVIADILSHF